jgi:hypothetical protein
MKRSTKDLFEAFKRPEKSEKIELVFKQNDEDGTDINFIVNGVSVSLEDIPRVDMENIITAVDGMKTIWESIHDQELEVQDSEFTEMDGELFED